MFTLNKDEMEIEGINEVELQHIGSQLINYVNAYKTLIRIDDEETIKRLDMLNDIGYKIINRQYQLLFNDPNVVIPNYDNQTLYDYQLQLLEEQNPSKLPF
jgi:methyl coenzyme M reductase subunit C-like uncharacterized protein (methanogenesis marker protein 7)